jgi:molybdopterin molybdotransferase
VHKFPRDGSGLISSLRESSGLVEIAEDVSEVKEGDLVDFIPFAELGLNPP